MKDNRTKAEIIKLHQQSISEINEKHKAKVSEMTDSYQKLFPIILQLNVVRKMLLWFVIKLTKTCRRRKEKTGI